MQLKTYNMLFRAFSHHLQFLRLMAIRNDRLIFLIFEVRFYIWILSFLSMFIWVHFQNSCQILQSKKNEMFKLNKTEFIAVNVEVR